MLKSVRFSEIMEKISPGSVKYILIERSNLTVLFLYRFLLMQICRLNCKFRKCEFCFLLKTFEQGAKKEG